MKKLLIGALAINSLAFAATETRSDLEKKLDSLNIPSDIVTPLVSEENLYAINNRYSSLVSRFEITAFGANNFSSDSHLESTLGGADVRYHFTDKWSVGYRYSKYANKLSEAGKRLFDRDEVLPDTDYPIKSNEGFVNFNTTYGKIRLTMDTVAYFDQYISLGYGRIGLGNGEANLYSADLGFAFWIGKKMSARVGVRNEFYIQQKINGDENVHHAQGYIALGYLFGEGRTSL
jgi:outer membrane beta-barrel protein